MGVGLGVLLLVLGAIFTWVVKVQIPGIDQYLLGYILMGAGLLVIVLSLILGAARGRTHTVATTQVAGQPPQVDEVQTRSNQTEV